ncbi:paladin-like isoform X2 [Styela clava]
MGDFWSILCPNPPGSSKGNKSTNGSDSRASKNDEQQRSARTDAASKRYSFSNTRKYTRSLPGSEVSFTESLYLNRQFSFGNVIMQNDCTVLNNKIGPVVIKNCKEEYQMRAIVENVTGRLHDQSTEHELLLDKFFLLKDHFVGIDRHETLFTHGVPNLRVMETSPTLYAIGQPTMNGLQKFMSTLFSKHQLIYYVNVRAVPTLFLRRSGDFIPYSGFSMIKNSDSRIYKTQKELHDAEREIQMQALRIASSNSGLFYYYNVLDSSPDEPHMYQTKQLDDLVTSRQLYAKLQSEHDNFKYVRLVLPNMDEPSSEWLDSLIHILKEVNVHKGESAIVFQGLTGEGPATLAALMALLASDMPITLDKTNKDKNDASVIKAGHRFKAGASRSRVQKIQNSIPWREYVISKLLDSWSQKNNSLRLEIDTSIACTSTPAILSFILKDVICNQQNKKMNIALMGRLKRDIRQSISRNESVDIDCHGNNANLTLRDISELSLMDPKKIREQAQSGKLIRYEVCDEEHLLKVLLLDSNLYYYLLVFRAYVLEQAKLSFQKSFSEWLVKQPSLIFDLSQAGSSCEMEVNEEHWILKRQPELRCDIPFDPTYHRIVGVPIYGIAQTTPKRFSQLVKRLSGPQSRKRYKRLFFINVRQESVFYTCNNVDEEKGEISTSEEKENSQWELSVGAIPCMHGAKADMIEEVEDHVRNAMEEIPSIVEFIGLPSDEHPDTLKTTSEVINDLNLMDANKDCGEIFYQRIPLPKYRIPRFECFDKLVQIIRDSEQLNSDAAYIFFCQNGKKRSTNMMVAGLLILTHLNKFELDLEPPTSISVDSWAPDAQFTRGEFKVVLELTQILPEFHSRKKEVDVALDLCHESMSTMHYHLREHLNPSYKKAKKAKDANDALPMKHKSYMGLEFYVFLILFNTYLHQQKKDCWRTMTFDQWMTQYAARLGVLNVLDNFGFMTFGEDYPMNLLRNRWLSTRTLMRNVMCESPNTSHRCVRPRIESLDTFPDSPTY